MLDDYFDELARSQHAKRVQLREAARSPVDIDRGTLAGQLYEGDSAAADLLFDDDGDDYDF